MAKENEVVHYRFGELNDGRTIIGKWVVYKDKKTLSDRGFWDFQLITRTSPGEGYDYKNRRVQFREEIPTKTELEEVFYIPETVVTAPKIEVPWRDCLSAQKYWRELMDMKVEKSIAVKKMCEKFPIAGPTESKYEGFEA